MKKLCILFAWTLIDGHRPLIQKDKGCGVMPPVFTSRELGFGFTVDEDT